MDVSPWIERAIFVRFIVGADGIIWLEGGGIFSPSFIGLVSEPLQTAYEGSLSALPVFAGRRVDVIADAWGKYIISSCC